MKTINTIDEFKEIIKSEKILVDFSAEWCGPCKMLKEVLKDLDNDNVIDIVQVDVDKFNGIAKSYKVFSVPTLMIFEKGELIRQKTGFMMKNELIEFINEE